MGNIINLKAVCLDYKPGQLDPISQKFRLKALEVYTYIEAVESGEIQVPEQANGISLCDFAILHNAI